MTKEELTEVIRLHKLWLEKKPEGKKADLQKADLQEAIFIEGWTIIKQENKK